MKLNFGKRFIMFLHWLASLLICAGLVLLVIKPPFAVQLYNDVTGRFTPQQLQIIVCAALAVYAILVIWELVIIFKRRKRSERGFVVVNSSDAGRVRIGVPAIEQTVRQAVETIEGISEMKVKIDGSDDAIDIYVDASIANGNSLPAVTMNMQQAIREFVQMNCGVAVRSIPVSIKTLTAPANTNNRKDKKKRKEALPAPAEINDKQDEVPSGNENNAAKPAEPEQTPAAEVNEINPTPVEEPEVQTVPVVASVESSEAAEPQPEPEPEPESEAEPQAEVEAEAPVEEESFEPLNPEASGEASVEEEPVGEDPFADPVTEDEPEAEEAADFGEPMSAWQADMQAMADEKPERRPSSWEESAYDAISSGDSGEEPESEDEDYLSDDDD